MVLLNGVNLECKSAAVLGHYFTAANWGYGYSWSSWVCIEMEGDALMVVASIQKDASANFSQFGRIIDDTRAFMDDYFSGEVGFCKREANKLANRLARFSLSSVPTATWFEEPPDIIWDILVEDKN